MSAPKPAAVIFVLTAAAAVSISDGAAYDEHITALAHSCVEQSSPLSPLCCAAIFAPVGDDEVSCLCRIDEDPYIVVARFGSRYFTIAFMDCGGVLPLRLI